MVLVFYVGCISFVIHRGYKCIGKYLSKPEGVEMSYNFIGDLMFPSFTFCSHNWNPLPPNRYNEKALKDCNLTLSEYAFFGRYIGNGGASCSDTKFLQNTVGIGYKELDIWGIKLTTFDRYLNGIQWANIGNDTYFEWTRSFLDNNRGGCHTLTFKESALTHGILWVNHLSILHQS